MFVAEKFAVLQKDKSAVVALVLSPLLIAVESGVQDTWHGLLKETIWVGKPYRQAESVYRILSRECERVRNAEFARIDLHRPHIKSVVPVSGSAALLPSSHSTHCWNCEPLRVEVKSESTQTMLSSVVPAVPVAHFDLQGELGVTSSPWMREVETSRRLKAKSAVLGIAIIAVAACRCQLQRWGKQEHFNGHDVFTLDLKPCGSSAYPLLHHTNLHTRER